MAIHEIVFSLSPTTFSGLLVFHAFTGCGIVSSFSGREKKTAGKTWKVFPEVTDAFFEMTNEQISEMSIFLLERFVILMHDKISECFGVNEARKKLFIHKSKSPENIPPTKAALEQHIKRASFQAHCWSQALVKNSRLPSPSDWRWVHKMGEWQPISTTLVEVAKFSYELICCKCKKSCIERCTCVSAALKCIALCLCSRDRTSYVHILNFAERRFNLRIHKCCFTSAHSSLSQVSASSS